MPPDPVDHLTIYLWVLWLSWWGASVAYLQRIKDKGPSAFSFWAFGIELLTSGFVGYVTYTLCEVENLNPKVTSVIVAIAGHMGTRAIFLVRDRVGLGAVKP